MDHSKIRNLQSSHKYTVLPYFSLDQLISDWWFSYTSLFFSNISKKESKQYDKGLTTNSPDSYKFCMHGWKVFINLIWQLYAGILRKSKHFIKMSGMLNPVNKNNIYLHLHEVNKAIVNNRSKKDICRTFNALKDYSAHSQLIVTSLDSSCF